MVGHIPLPLYSLQDLSWYPPSTWLVPCVLGKGRPTYQVVASRPHPTTITIKEAEIPYNQKIKYGIFNIGLNLVILRSQGSSQIGLQSPTALYDTKITYQSTWHEDPSKDSKGQG